MSGSVSQMLSLAIVSVVAYITATLVKSEPIYESLLNRLLAAQESASGEGTGTKGNAGKTSGSAGGQKVLSEFVIMSGSGPGRPDGHGDPLAEELPSGGS